MRVNCSGPSATHRKRRSLLGLQIPCSGQSRSSEHFSPLPVGMTGEELPFLPHSEQDVTGSQAGKSYFNPNQQPASIIWAGGPGINVYLEEGDRGLWMSTSGSPPQQWGWTCCRNLLRIFLGSGLSLLLCEGRFIPFQSVHHNTFLPLRVVITSWLTMPEEI